VLRLSTVVCRLYLWTVCAVCGQGHAVVCGQIQKVTTGSTMVYARIRRICTAVSPERPDWPPRRSGESGGSMASLDRAARGRRGPVQRWSAPGPGPREQQRGLRDPPTPTAPGRLRLYTRSSNMHLCTLNSCISTDLCAMSMTQDEHEHEYAPNAPRQRCSRLSASARPARTATRDATRQRACYWHSSSRGPSS